MDYQDIFAEKKRGIYKQVTLPVFGSQDVGITPGGVMDRFSFDCGNGLLGNPPDSPALEIVLPPVLQVKANVYFTLTGAQYVSPVVVNNGIKTPVPHGTVCFAAQGSELVFGSKKSGLRSYLCYKKIDRDVPESDMLQRSLNGLVLDFWIDGDGCKRVIEGPEYRFLKNPEAFFNTAWTVGLQTGEMGMGLESSTKLEIGLENMISESVATGTVQLPPNGPIVLLKHRQTIGGYPRIFSVITPDIDLLAQYMPGQTLKFKKVSLPDAWQICRQQKAAINIIRKLF